MPPREVFERPPSPFIARLIGSHNVLRGIKGRIAVRVDRCWLGSVQDGPNLTGQVAAVEYQGAMARVAVMTEAGETGDAGLGAAGYPCAGGVAAGPDATACCAAYRRLLAFAIKTVREASWQAC